MPFKKGGGDESQLYDSNNGQYVDENHISLFQKEFENIVMRYIFNLKGTHYPRFPVYKFHNDDYCEIFVKYAIYNVYKDIPYPKIENYLLKYRPVNDKSKFFKGLGFTLKDKEELQRQIYYNSDFSKMKYNHLDEFGLTVEVPTIIESLIDGRKYVITSYWICDSTEFMMRFTSVNVNEKENRKWNK